MGVDSPIVSGRKWEFDFGGGIIGMWLLTLMAIVYLKGCN